MLRMLLRTRSRKVAGRAVWRRSGLAFAVASLILIQPPAFGGRGFLAAAWG